MRFFPLRRRWFFQRLFPVLGALSVLVALVAIPEATARTSFDSPYSYEQTYQGALRYVRVDLGLRVLEKDPAAGYLLFEYQSQESGPRVSSGSVEFISTASAVRVLVQLPQMPRYHEQVFANGLEKKLRNEYGTPSPRPPASAPIDDAGKPDGGAGAPTATGE